MAFPHPSRYGPRKAVPSQPTPFCQYRRCRYNRNYRSYRKRFCVRCIEEVNTNVEPSPCSGKTTFYAQIFTDTVLTVGLPDRLTRNRLESEAKAKRNRPTHSPEIRGSVWWTFRISKCSAPSVRQTRTLRCEM